MADPLDLIVEDGTGSATANSYVSVARASELLAERGFSDKWTGTSIDDYKKSQALIAAFHALNKLDWKGLRSTTTQRGAWPRTFVENRYRDALIAANAIPQDLEYAQAYLALRLVTQDRYDLAEQRGVMSSSNAGRSKSVQVGHPANQSIIPQEVWGWIGVYVNVGTARLVRAA